MTPRVFVTAIACACLFITAMAAVFPDSLHFWARAMTSDPYTPSEPMCRGFDLCFDRLKIENLTKDDFDECSGPDYPWCDTSGSNAIVVDTPGPYIVQERHSTQYGYGFNIFSGECGYLDTGHEGFHIEDVLLCYPGNSCLPTPAIVVQSDWDQIYEPCSKDFIDGLSVGFLPTLSQLSDDVVNHTLQLDTQLGLFKGDLHAFATIVNDAMFAFKVVARVLGGGLLVLAAYVAYAHVKAMPARYTVNPYVNSWEALLAPELPKKQEREQQPFKNDGDADCSLSDDSDVGAHDEVPADPGHNDVDSKLVDVDEPELPMSRILEALRKVDELLCRGKQDNNPDGNTSVLACRPIKPDGRKILRDLIVKRPQEVLGGGRGLRWAFLQEYGSFDYEWADKSEDWLACGPEKARVRLWKYLLHTIGKEINQIRSQLSDKPLYLPEGVNEQNFNSNPKGLSPDDPREASLDPWK